MGLVGKLCLWPRFNLSQLDGHGSARGEGLNSAKQNMLACSQKLERGPSQTGKTNGCRQPVRAIEAKTWAKSLLTPGFALVDPDACQTWGLGSTPGGGVEHALVERICCLLPYMEAICITLYVCL